MLSPLALIIALAAITLRWRYWTMRSRALDVTRVPMVESPKLAAIARRYDLASFTCIGAAAGIALAAFIRALS